MVLVVASTNVALTELKLEYELMVVTTPIPQHATGWLQGTAHHFETVDSLEPCEQTLPSLMNRVHYTVLLVSSYESYLESFATTDHSFFSQLIAGNIGNSSITTTLSQLLEPVTTEHSELVVGDTSDVSNQAYYLFTIITYYLQLQTVGMSQAALSLLLSPITDTIHIPPSLLLAVSKKALDGCEGITGDSGSLVAELLAKCYWSHWQMIRSTGVHSVSRPLSFSQV